MTTTPRTRLGRRSRPAAATHRRSRRGEGLIWAALAGVAIGLVGAVGMLRSPGSEVLGSAGRPEGWFGLVAVLLALFFIAVYRTYRRPRALKLAALMGIAALVAGLAAAVTLPPDCGQLGEQGLPLSCLDVYGKDPEVALSPSTWGIWLLAIGGLLSAGASIVALFSLAEQPAPRTAQPQSRRTPQQRVAGRRASARR